MKNYMIEDKILNDMGYVKNPKMILTDEGYFDLCKSFKITPEKEKKKSKIQKS